MSDKESPPAQTTYRLHGNTRQIVKAKKSNSKGSDQTSVLLFSNSRIRVSDFRLCSAQSVIIEHRFPTIRWQVAYNGIVEHRLEITESNGRTEISKENVADREVFFVEPQTTWKLTNTSSSAEYRQIVFEILSEVPLYTEEKVQELFRKAKFSTDVGTELLFENNLCRVWDFYLEPGEGGGADTVHHHCLDYIFINVAPSRLLGLHPETLSLDDLLFDSVSEDNQVTWNSIPENAGTDLAFAHGGKNGYNDKPMREYLVELK